MRKIKKMALAITAAVMTTSALAAPASAQQITGYYDYEGAGITSSHGLIDGAFRSILYAMNQDHPDQATYPSLVKRFSWDDYSLKATIKQGARYSRSESVVGINNMDKGVQTVEFDTYIPLDYDGPIGTEWTMIHQVWQTKCNGPAISLKVTPNTQNNYRLNLSAFVSNESYTNNWTKVAHPPSIGLTTIPKGQWVKITEQWNASKDPSKSFYSLSINGVKKIHVTGLKIGYRGNDCSGAPLTTNLVPKIGIYHGGPAAAEDINIFYDNVKVSSEQ